METLECKIVAEDDFSRRSGGGFPEPDSVEEEKFHSFSDRDFANFYRFKGIRIRSGDVVDAIQFVYGEDESKGWYGGPGGTLKEFFFGEGEYITCVEWVTGMYQNYPLLLTAYVCFHTNKGRKFAAGNEYSCTEGKCHTVHAELGTYFHSFSGRYEKYFLGFDTCYYRTMGLLRFDDKLYVQGRKRITEIRINAGAVIDGIQLVYDGDKETKFYGGTGGSRTTLRLQSGEYISSISGKIGRYEYQSGDTLCHIEIKTDQGNSISGGTMYACSNMMDFCYNAGTGEQIFALTGEYMGYMSSLEVSMYTLKGSAPVAGDSVQTDMGPGGEEQAPGKDMSLQGMEGASLRNALRGGCFDKNVLQDMLDCTLEAAEPGGICWKFLQQRAYEITSTVLTRKYVNTPQYIFRSPLGWELGHNQKEREMFSKYQKHEKNYKPVIALDKQNGEQYKYATTLRALAIKSSTDPSSQFVSVALDFRTAEDFKQNDLMLAYKLIPNSPLLGLKDGGKLKGEDQFQVLGGTAIIELYKFTNKRWYQYNYDTKKWNQTRRIPVNQEYERLKAGEL